MEFTEYNFDIEKMRSQVEIYNTERYFPKEITFSEHNPPHNKTEVFKACPEDYPGFIRRVVKFNAEMTKNLQ